MSSRIEASPASPSTCPTGANPRIVVTGKRIPGSRFMRKIRIIEHISLDGVIQAPGGPNEDGDYPWGGWAVPHADPAVGEAIDAVHGEAAFDLLLGRRTYDIWSDYWPNAGSSPMADRLNAATKYVATHRPQTLTWSPAEHLGPDPVERLRGIKADGGPDLVVWGSSALTPMLLGNGLAEEIVLLVYPVLLGEGKRFFPEGTPAWELVLVGTKAASSGVVISTYRPGGPLRTGSFDAA